MPVGVHEISLAEIACAIDRTGTKEGGLRPPILGERYVGMADLDNAAADAFCPPRFGAPEIACDKSNW